MKLNTICQSYLATKVIMVTFPQILCYSSLPKSCTCLPHSFQSYCILILILILILLLNDVNINNDSCYSIDIDIYNDIHTKDIVHIIVEVITMYLLPTIITKIMKSQSPFQSVEMWHWSVLLIRIIIWLLLNKKGITIVHMMITLR